MLNKFAHSQSTVVTTLRHPAAGSKQADAQTTLRNPFKQKLPLKFPKRPIVKASEQHMLTQTTQVPEPVCLRVYAQHNRSRFFEDSLLPLSQTEIISRHPQYLFDGYNQRKLSNPGEFGHLARQSYQLPIRMRTYEDIGVTNNQKLVFSRLHYKPDPISIGQPERRFNSSLESVWREPRRHRDNGLQCRHVIQQKVNLKKREPYGQPTTTATPISTTTANNMAKNASYTEKYLKSKNLRKK